MLLQKIARQFRATNVLGSCQPNFWPETVVAVGIQAPPGSTITFENGNAIDVGITGIYEIDVEGFGYIPKPRIVLVSRGTVLIDYIYFTSAQEGVN